MAFLKNHHLLVAAVLFGLAAVIYLLGDPTGAMGPLLAGVFVEGLACVAVTDGESRDVDTGG
ncbi:MAG: hypothetical protein ACXWUM_10610 [Burkholderiaceae bacterium]